VKRIALTMTAVVASALTFAGAALAQTPAPTAPSIDVYQYAAGIFNALDANLTAVLLVSGLMAGTFLVLRFVRGSKCG
jgi:hypothetical protein